MKLSLKIIACVFILLVTGFSVLIFLIYKQSNIQEAQKADAIVVLGASQWNGKPSPVFKARLDHAYYIYQQRYASVIILTGGVGEGEKISESQVGKKYLVKKGIKENAILLERHGRTSWQSLKEVAKIMENNNFHTMILVSDGFHIMRLKSMSKKLGYKAYGSAVLDSPIKKNKLSEFKYVIRECGVFILFLLFKV